MRFAGAFLADSASIREGLISILSAGVTRFRPQAYPAPVNGSLVVIVEFDSSELEKHNETKLDVVIRNVMTSEVLMSVDGFFRAESNDDVDPLLPSYANLVFDLSGVHLKEPGYHVVELNVGDLPQRMIQFNSLPVN